MREQDLVRPHLTACQRLNVVVHKIMYHAVITFSSFKEKSMNITKIY